jgi:recombination protein RecA
MPPPGLDALLRDLGANVRRGGSETPPAPCWPTGLAELDRALGGGVPRGRVSELVGPSCCGSTSLALALLAGVTAQGELAAWIDRPDAFDAASAASAGVALERVLWVRPAGLVEALRSAEHVLHAGGFPLVLLDLAPFGRAPRVPAAAWPRLRKAAAAAGAALVLLGRERLAGSYADLALELEPGAPRFESGPDWLAGLDARVRLARSRAGPAHASIPLRWRAGRSAA